MQVAVDSLKISINLLMIILDFFLNLLAVIRCYIVIYNKPEVIIESALLKYTYKQSVPYGVAYTAFVSQSHCNIRLRPRWGERVRIYNIYLYVRALSPCSASCCSEYWRCSPLSHRFSLSLLILDPINANRAATVIPIVTKPISKAWPRI